MKDLGLNLKSMVVPDVSFKIETANDTIIANERTLRVILYEIRNGGILIDEVKITDSIGTVATFDSFTRSLSNELFGLILY